MLKFLEMSRDIFTSAINAIQEHEETLFLALCCNLDYILVIPLVPRKNMITRLLSLPNLLADKVG